MRAWPSSWATGDALVGIMLAGALLLTACDPSSSSGGAGRGAASTRTSTAADQQHGARQADSLAKRLIARTDSAFEAVEVLSAAEKRGLRRYLQDEHLARARRLGLDPVQDRRAAARLMSRHDEAVYLRTNDFYIIDPRMGYAVPLVVPSAVHLLDRIGQRFQKNLLAKALPPYRFIVTNVLRTGIDQAHLRGHNVNAAQGQSTHEYGTTTDLFYGRFHYAAVHDTPARRAASSDLNGTHLRQRLRRAYRRFGKTRARKLKAVLGRTLLQMQREGLLLATYEREQSVFHLTVAREVEAPRERAFDDSARRMTASMRRLYANTESRLTDISNDIDELEAQAQSASGKTQERLEGAVTKLKSQRDGVRSKMRRLDATAPSAFQAARSDLWQRQAALEGEVERARIEAMEQKRAVRSHVRTQVQNMERTVSQLEGLIAQADAGVQGEYRQRVSDLRARLGDLKNQLDVLQGASGQAFVRQRDEVADAVARLHTDLEITFLRITFHVASARTVEPTNTKIDG